MSTVDPLVISAEAGTYRSLDRLDFKQEEDLIFDGLRETGKMVRVRKYSGTTESLRCVEILTYGCHCYLIKILSLCS